MGREEISEVAPGEKHADGKITEDVTKYEKKKYRSGVRDINEKGYNMKG